MIKTTLPVLILKGAILFPNSEIRLEIDNNKDKELVLLAETYFNSHILIANQKDPLEENPDVTELPMVGVIGIISLKLDLPNGKTRIVIKGIQRAKISCYEKDDDVLNSILEPVVEDSLESFEEVAYARSLIRQLEMFIDNVPYMSNSILSQINNMTDINKLTDIVAIYIPSSYERKLELLEECNPVIRVRMLLDDINKELKVIDLEKKLEQDVSKELEKAQKEFVLREKLKLIREELGDINDKDSEVDQLKSKVNILNAPKKIKDRLMLEIHRYESCSTASPELGVIRNYIDWLLSLPWKKETKDNLDLNKAVEILNNSHYGLDKIKERIIEFLALRQMTKNANSPILCFVGPPGVGKTTLAKSIATAINRHVTKISVGGINDEAEIVGHRKTYIGAAPGKIIQGMKKVDSSNPVFIIDEIDKMTKDIKGDPASSLLDVLDKEQNNSFQDLYIEEEFDLSKVMFICTANYKEQIPLELLDRLEVIELSSYTEYEKFNIAKYHIIPKEIINHGLKERNVLFSDDAIFKIIRNYTKEAGVRELEREISSVLRKIVKEIVVKNKKRFKYVIEENDVTIYLGNEKYLYNQNEIIKKIGVVNGMSYMPSGGDILPIEIVHYKGSGNIIATGSLGDVFVESVKIAISYIKANCEKFEIEPSLISESDIHIHVPEGAIKKDGPSAGVAITTALISSFTGKKISSEISMTGEITLNGDVLAIGGLKEKVIGAKRANIKRIYLPKTNKKDLDDIDEYIKKGIKFVMIDNYEQIISNLLEEKL